MNKVSQQRVVSFTEAQRRMIAELLPRFSTRLRLDERGSRSVPFKPRELQAIKKAAAPVCLNEESGLRRNTIRHILEAIDKGMDQDHVSIPVGSRLYQLRISLLDSDPDIWRRILIKDCTLDKLHAHIQTAMGWTNSHLHQFEIDGRRYGNPALLDNGFGDFDCFDSTATRISDVIPKDGRRFGFRYEYDFGDGWEHEVLFEGVLQAESGKRYPACLEGERACPPEDVGGIWGYYEFFEAIRDPNHEMHEDYTSWAGDFDPDDFDSAKTTKRMRRGLPNFH